MCLGRIEIQKAEIAKLTTELSDVRRTLLNVQMRNVGYDDTLDWVFQQLKHMRAEIDAHRMCRGGVHVSERMQEDGFTEGQMPRAEGPHKEDVKDGADDENSEVHRAEGTNDIPPAKDSCSYDNHAAYTDELHNGGGMSSENVGLDQCCNVETGKINREFVHEKKVDDVDDQQVELQSNVDNIIRRLKNKTKCTFRHSARKE